MMQSANQFHEKRFSAVHVVEEFAELRNGVSFHCDASGRLKDRAIGGWNLIGAVAIGEGQQAGKTSNGSKVLKSQ